MKLFTLSALVVGLVAANRDFLSDEYIDSINQVATTWKAGRNFNKNTPHSYIQGLLGTIINDEQAQDVLPVRSYEDVDFEALPAEFDARDQWPDCPSISEIRDQSDCGSCWAIAAAEIMTDRQCIHKGGQYFHYSTEDIVSCCDYCAIPKNGGCNGGQPYLAMLHWEIVGVVSGGQYGGGGCQPYSLQPCDHHVDGTLPNCETFNFTTPECKEYCQSSYDVSYWDDKHFAKQTYVIPRNETEIMYEIMTNGPVEGDFTVYDDFLSYKSGVYQVSPNATAEGGHAIRILGWGTEDGTPYWLCANSWNIEWGDQGYFKIIRGQNEAGIEQGAVGGIPA